MKIVFALLSSLFAIWAFIPYLRDMFRGKTQPHGFTFLIWGITQGTSTAILLHGGGSWGALGSMFTVSLSIVVFVLSFWYGTKNIKPIDWLVLGIALGAILIWWGLSSPVAAVLLLAGIDLIGYIPTYRKTYEEPWTETLQVWIISSFAVFLAILALGEYNMLTMTYLLTILVANVILVAIILQRRKIIKTANT